MSKNFKWTKQIIQWYASAVDYTGFGYRLADVLTKYLPKNETVCDLGCGIGYFALELFERGYDVTAVDKNMEAIGWLKEQCERRRISALKVLNKDWKDLGDKPLWDNIVMVCAGWDEENAERYRHLCKKRLIIVDRARLSSHVRADGGDSAWRQSLSDESQSLGGECFAPISFSLEFGQPLASIEDAREYISTFGGTEAMEQTLSALVNTGDADFPLYLPYCKELKLLALPALRLKY